MANSHDEAFKKVMMWETYSPHTDRERFLAFMLLKQKYPKLTYWSHNGYDCDALADYSFQVVWDKQEIIDWETKNTFKTTEKSFFDCTMTEIVDTWVEVLKEIIDDRDQKSEDWR